MPGAIPILSSHGLTAIIDLFIKELDGPIMTQGKKTVWHNLCLAKAGVEVYKGNKMKAEDQHKKLRDNYDRWASLICNEDAACGAMSVPGYVTENMFRTTDINNLKMRPNTAKGNLALWRQWVKMKSAVVVNFDNAAVRKAITRMPGHTLPSGTDFGLFLRRLKYELYHVRSKTSCDALGGSSAKKPMVQIKWGIHQQMKLLLQTKRTQN